MTDTPQLQLNYKDAGVDIDAGNELVERIKPIAKRTRRPEMLSGLGGFGAFCQLPSGYKEPVLVSGADGVGTKLALAMQLGIHNTIGIDLVAMCANDLLVSGAEPLFFLDYYATGALDVETAASVIEGIGRGCELAGCALAGGETAEMPGMYHGEDYDLAGFCVGVVERDNIIDGTSVRIGDKLIGLTSSGPHSNGYSLIRKILELTKADLNQPFGDSTLGETLLTPTRIYTKPVLQAAKRCRISAMAHITGGGILENIPRVLPDNTAARIDLGAWKQPEIFGWLQENGGIDGREMLRTFNCGLGMVIAVNKDDAEELLAILKQQGVEAMPMGEIVAQPKSDKDRVIVEGARAA